MANIKRHARGPQLAHQMRQAKGQGLPGNQGFICDLEVLRGGQRPLRAGVHVADEKGLLEGGRLRRELFPRGQDKARAAKDLQVVAAHRPHAHKPGVKLCRVLDKARLLKRAGHRGAGVVHRKAVGRQIHHDVYLDLVVDEVVDVLVGKGDGDLLALEVDDGHLARVHKRQVDAPLAVAAGQANRGDRAVFDKGRVKVGHVVLGNHDGEKDRQRQLLGKLAQDAREVVGVRLAVARAHQARAAHRAQGKDDQPRVLLVGLARKLQDASLDV